MTFGRPLLLSISLLLLQGCFDEPKHVDEDTNRSKASLQMQKPDVDTHDEKAE
ncbi:hypothetical protein ACIPZG_06520 [Pseudomonas sp. NPDC089395]|uniref:hypothetical protein n=1 Tax=Pseudomonas sp. NPDC089395 TaxID=3364460 RepID=UPI003812F5C1